MLHTPSNFGIKYHIPECDKSNCSAKCFAIENVSTFKYLGILLDCNLSWKPHCTNIKQYIYMAVCKFYLLRTLVPVEILNKIYFALIQSKLSYGLVFWGGTYDSTLKPLTVAQNMIIKSMSFKKKRSSSWPLYLKKGILPLKHLYIFRVLKLFFSRSGNRMFKILKQYNLRKNNLCFIPRTNSTLFQKCFLVTAPKIYNNIPNNIKSATNVNEFCNWLKAFLFTLSDITVLFV